MLSKLIEMMTPLHRRRRPPERLASYPSLESLQAAHRKYVAWGQARLEHLSDAYKAGVAGANDEYWRFQDLTRKEAAEWTRLGDRWR